MFLKTKKPATMRPGIQKELVRPGVLGRRRAVRWAKRIGIGILVLVVAAAVMSYVDQRRAIDTVKTDVAKAGKLGAETAAEVKSSLDSDWGRALLSSEPLTGDAWTEFETAVVDNDKDTLTDLQNDLRKWAATNIVYPNLAAEFEQFIEDVQLSVTPEQRAELTAVIALEQACNDLAAGREIDTVELSRIFGLDRGDTLGRGVVEAAPELCTID